MGLVFETRNSQFRCHRFNCEQLSPTNRVSIWAFGGAINVPATSDKVPGGALDANGTPIFSDEAFVARFTWDGQPDAVFGGLGLGYDGGVSGTRSARSCTSLTLSNQMPVCIGDEPRHLQDIGRTRILKFER